MPFDCVKAVNSCVALADLRSNENFSLMALHTLFVKEHNRRCDWLVSQYPSWSDEELYQAARRFIIALIQV